MFWESVSSFHSICNIFSCHCSSISLVLCYFLKSHFQIVSSCWWCYLSPPVRCVFDSVCSVTSSSVINLAKQVAPVPDRCAYTLMSEPGVQLLAVFQDRRRRDVTFLDQVILRLDNPGVNIYLGQGGRVQVNYLQPQFHLVQIMSSSHPPGRWISSVFDLFV